MWNSLSGVVVKKLYNVFDSLLDKNVKKVLSFCATFFDSLSNAKREIGCNGKQAAYGLFSALISTL